MLHRNVIQVYEFERLTIHDGRGFEQRHLSALEAYNDKYENKYYTQIRDGIRFCNYVGVLQIGNLTIEILPKVEKHQSDKDKGTWRSVLLQMLRECRFLKVNEIDNARLNLKQHSILDIYLQMFMDATEKLLHEGLVKKYQKRTGNTLALKGQLQFSKHVANNLVHKERFYVRYTEYNSNNIFNQILYKTIQLIPKLSRNPFLHDRVCRLKLDFPEVSYYKADESTFNKLAYDRKTERYKETMLIAKMLLLNYRPDITGGSESVIAILFDMNELWEEFVYRRLKKEEGKDGINSVNRQQRKPFWQHEQSSYSKIIKPDIVVEYAVNNVTKTTVIDTKWKILDDLLPADDDLKQMFVYNLYWGCERSVLLYPASGSNCNHGNYHDFREDGKFNAMCSVETVSVLDENNILDCGFGRRLASRICT